MDYIFPTYNTFTLHTDRNTRGVMAQVKDLEEHLLSYLPKKQEFQMRIAVTAKQLKFECPQLLIFQSFHTILVTADSSSSTLFCWPFRCYWIYPVLDTFEYFVSQPGPPEVLTRMQVHSTQAFAFTSDRNSNVPPADADAAVDTLRPRCRGAFLPIFSVLCLFLFALLTDVLLCSLSALSSFSLLCCLLCS